MDEPSLRTSLQDGILTLTMNRPNKKNAISLHNMMEITDTLKQAAENNEVEFVILTGAGDYYSSGMDLSPQKEHSISSSDILRIGREFVAGFIDFPKLLIAIVNGPAVGIAVTTLGLCDLVFCSTKSTFWTPFTTHGLNVEGCSSYIFPRIMGYTRANEVLQFGRKFTANEAKEWNFVSEVYEPEELRTVLLPKIQQIKNSVSKESIKANKKLIRQWDMKLLHEVNNAEWEELENRFSSPEFIEAIIKFSKRKLNGNKL